MKTRMERYIESPDDTARTKKNQDLYEDIYNNLPSSNISSLDNESEIDLSKIEEIISSREGYKRVKEYQSIVKTKEDPEDYKEEYDIYEDIDNKIYDINMILEDAKSKRVVSEREKYRNLRNTQYDILSKLDFKEEQEEPEEMMVTDFFTQDKEIKGLMKDVNKANSENKKDFTEETSHTKTSLDLFDDLKGNENTVLTEAIKEDVVINELADSNNMENTFYTGHLSFTKEDFEGFQNLQTTVKKNNRLIKVLITVLAIVLIMIVGFLVFVLF